MAGYGRRYKNNGKNNLASLPGQSVKNKAVKRVYKKAVAAPKTLAQTNTQAVFTLSKQVKSLQNLTHGYLQKRVDQEVLTNLDLPHPGQPIAFEVTNFYNANPVYQGLVDPATGLATGQVVGSFNKPVYDAGLQDQYEWNARGASDVVSQITYKPVFTRLNFKFTAKNGGASRPARVRVTLLKFKGGYHDSNKLSVGLPTALGAYRNLCLETGDPSRNFFSPRFHNIVYDRWITLPNNCKTAEEKSIEERFLSIPHTFKDYERVTPDFDQHPPGQLVWTNTPINQQMWCIISCNTPADSLLSQISMSRLLSWRDFHGVAG